MWSGGCIQRSAKVRRRRAESTNGLWTSYQVWQLKGSPSLQSKLLQTKKWGRNECLVLLRSVCLCSCSAKFFCEKWILWSSFVQFRCSLEQPATELSVVSALWQWWHLWPAVLPRAIIGKIKLKNFDFLYFSESRICKLFQLKVIRIWTFYADHLIHKLTKGLSVSLPL